MGMLLVTLAPAGQTANLITGEGWRFIEGAEIVMVNPDKPSNIKKLSTDFFSACSPDVSWDGRNMVFAGQKKKGDPWRIWRMDFKSGKSQQVFDTSGSYTDPVILPAGKTAYTGNAEISKVNALFVCNDNGSARKQITFHPHTNFATSVLKDGRLLLISRQIKPIQGDPLMMVIRPDGTKADLFYRPPSGSSLTSKARESSDGQIFFTETDSAGAESIISIKYNRPLHSRQLISNETSGRFNSVFPYSPETLIVSYASGPGNTFDLYEFSLKDKKPGRKIRSFENFDVVDVIAINEHQRPKKLPSEVDPGVKTGLLLLQDINFSALEKSDVNSRKATKIEIIGLDSSMGLVHVEKDGSCYLKVLADKPFRIRTLDDNNQQVNAGTPWLWLRPNERRGFVGLRDDDEMAPMNRVSLAVRKDPVIVPVVVSEIIEKEVELE
jgi:hypothetical protein